MRLRWFKRVNSLDVRDGTATQEKRGRYSVKMIGCGMSGQNGGWCKTGEGEG